jgi:chromosome segregation ATPase
MDRLGEHMRSHITSEDLQDVEENILHFPANTAGYRGSALELVSQAAGVMKEIQERAAETEASAKGLVDKALEKLRLMGARVHSAETACRDAEEDISKLVARVKELERALAHTTAEKAKAEAQHAEAQKRLTVAEARAVTAENTATQIENLIRIQLMGLQKRLTSRPSRAA